MSQTHPETLPRSCGNLGRRSVDRLDIRGRSRSALTPAGTESAILAKQRANAPSHHLLDTPTTFPLRRTLRQIPRHKRLPDFTQPVAAAIQQHALARHEHGVPVDIRAGVHPRDDFGEEGFDFVVGALRVEFGDPDGAALGEGAGGGDVGLEVGGVAGGVVPGREGGLARGIIEEEEGCEGEGKGRSERVRYVPMQTDEVDRASVTLVHEILQPVETHAVHAVGYSG
jgi:hypothetical protein